MRPKAFQWPIRPDGHPVQHSPAPSRRGRAEIQINARSEAGVAYIVDLTGPDRHADEAQMHAFIFAEAPRASSSFARRVIADAVRDAGFTPVLEPIDFGALYFQQMPRRPKVSRALGQR
jgi:preprotein translocase subunit SecB